MSQKRPCARCGKPWSVEAFSANPTSYCRECRKAKARLRRADPKVQARERERARELRRERPDYVVAARQYYSRNPESSMKRTNKWRSKNPEKSRAIVAVYRAIRIFDLERKPCECCGTDKNVCAFPMDYSQPLKVKWRCRFCNNELQRQAASAPSSNDQTSAP